MRSVLYVHSASTYPILECLSVSLGATIRCHPYECLYQHSICVSYSSRQSAWFFELQYMTKLIGFCCWVWLSTHSSTGERKLTTVCILRRGHPATFNKQDHAYYAPECIFHSRFAYCTHTLAHKYINIICRSRLMYTRAQTSNVHTHKAIEPIC